MVVVVFDFYYNYYYYIIPKISVHVHSGSTCILKCLDAHGGCVIVIQDIMKRLKTQDQAWLV